MNPRPFKPMRGAARAIIFQALFLGFLAAPVHADPDSSWVRTAQSAVRVISAVEAVGDLARLPLGLEFELAPGWKTYWRSPGDAGLPATVDLSGSLNAANAELGWPVPHRFELFGLQTFGYADHVILPLWVGVAVPGKPVSLTLNVRYLVCEVICIPVEAQLLLDLAAGAATPSAMAPQINRFASLIPKGPDRMGWQVAGPSVDSKGAIVIDVTSELEPLRRPDVIVEQSPTHAFLPVRATIAPDGMHARLVVPSARVAEGPPLEQQDLVLTIFDGDNAAEIAARPLPSVPGGTGGGLAFPVLGILGIALLGGLVLNVMPCVLPVLILKLTGVLEMSRLEGRRLRLSFLATSAGILVSFLALAGVLSLFKLSGASVGWGMQFQQPVFLGVMALVCLVFAANLFGLFAVPMPAFVGAVSLAGERRIENRHAKAFFSGVLATALATPCSAPFVGTAIAFALSRGPLEIFSIFTALGLGLAAPYLAVAAVPAVVSFLPRPGPWLKWLKWVLGVSLLGTSLWLGSVIVGQVGWARTWVAADQNGPWVPFEEERIDDLVAMGRTVFVDVTADWCLTCQANKKLVLDREPIAGLLSNNRIVAMRADWTNPDRAIAAFLARFGRYGIPFNVVFGPNSRDGVVLSELLSVDDVAGAIAVAGGPVPSAKSP